MGGLCVRTNPGVRSGLLRCKETQQTNFFEAGVVVIPPSSPILVDHVPVLLEGSQGVAHGMSVLHHNQRMSKDVTLVEGPILFQLLVAGIHGAVDVGVSILRMRIFPCFLVGNEGISRYIQIHIYIYVCIYLYIYICILFKG